MITITFGWWCAPALATVAVWLWTFLSPKDEFGSNLALITGIPDGAIALIVTLVIWLSYFVRLSI